jgi:hypothetical protein
MHAQQFDDLTRLAATQNSRRGMFKAIAAAFGGMALGKVADVDPANAQTAGTCSSVLNSVCYNSHSPRTFPQCCFPMTCVQHPNNGIGKCMCLTPNSICNQPVGSPACCTPNEAGNPCRLLDEVACSNGYGCVYKNLPDGWVCQTDAGQGFCQDGMCVVSACAGASLGQPCLGGTASNGQPCYWANATLGIVYNPDGTGNFILSCVCSQTQVLPGYQNPYPCSLCDPSGPPPLYTYCCPPGWHCYFPHCLPDCT